MRTNPGWRPDPRPRIWIKEGGGGWWWLVGGWTTHLKNQIGSWIPHFRGKNKIIIIWNHHLDEVHQIVKSGLTTKPSNLGKFGDFEMLKNVKRSFSTQLATICGYLVSEDTFMGNPFHSFTLDFCSCRRDHISWGKLLLEFFAKLPSSPGPRPRAAYVCPLSISRLKT